MKIELDITKVTVLTGVGTDTVMIHTQLPNPIWPYEGVAVLSLQAAAGSGEAYSREHFKTEPEVIQMVKGW